MLRQAGARQTKAASRDLQAARIVEPGTNRRCFRSVGAQGSCPSSNRGAECGGHANQTSQLVMSGNWSTDRGKAAPSDDHTAKFGRTKALQWKTESLAARGYRTRIGIERKHIWQLSANYKAPPQPSAAAGRKTGFSRFLRHASPPRLGGESYVGPYTLVPMPPCLFDAVIFDFDGVLIDSEPLYSAATNAVLHGSAAYSTPLLQRSTAACAIPRCSRSSSHCWGSRETSTITYVSHASRKRESSAVSLKPSRRRDAHVTTCRAERTVRRGLIQ